MVKIRKILAFCVVLLAAFNLDAVSQVHKLDVYSVNPNSGVFIQAPSDQNGNWDGYTPFTRYYLHNNPIFLVAPSMVNGNSFLKWQQDGRDFYFYPNVSFPMDGNHTMTAVYSSPAPPHIDLSPQTLPAFAAVRYDPPPSSQTFNISNAGGGTLNWSISGVPSWLNVSPMSGTNNQTVSVSVINTSMSPNTYSASLRVSSNAENDPQYENISYTISPAPPPPPPSNISVIDAGSGDKIVVKWNPPASEQNITAYEIGYGLSAGSYTQPYVSVPVSEHQGTISGLQTYSPYWIAVRSRNSDGLASSWTLQQPNDTAVYATIPVVLVHGWRSEPSIWDDPSNGNHFREWFLSRHFNHIWIANNLDACGVYGETFFSGNARLLSLYVENRISQLKTTTGNIEVPTINIVAHSMGGLISRRYISSKPPDTWFHRQVKNLVMLGTPNAGVFIGKYDCFWKVACYPASCELGSPKMLDFNSNYGNRAGTSYWVASGDGGCTDRVCHKESGNCLGIVNRCAQEFCPNDGIVSRFSAGWTVPFDHIICGSWCHTGYYKDFTLLTAYIIPILKGQLISTNSCAVSTLAPGIESTPPQIILSKCDSIEFATTRTDSFTTEPGTLNVLVRSSDSNFRFTLESPSGEVWDSARAANDSLVVYQSDEEGSAFSFDSISAGKWLIHFDARNIGMSFANFCVDIAQGNSVAFRPSISENYPLPETPISLNVSLVDGISPLTGANVNVIPMQYDSTSLLPINLMDDGNHNDGGADDGVYGGVFNQQADSGGIVFDFAASGTSSIGPFRREARLPAIITLGPIVLGDLNRDRVLSPADVVLELNCIFLNLGNCGYSIADVNCDGNLSPADVVMELYMVFLQAQSPCPT